MSNEAAIIWAVYLAAALASLVSIAASLRQIAKALEKK